MLMERKIKIFISILTSWLLFCTSRPQSVPTTCRIDVINLFGKKKKADVKKSSHMTDGIPSHAGTTFQQAFCRPFTKKCTSGYICSSPGLCSSGFYLLCSPIWVPARCYVQALISVCWCHHFWQDICWDHIIFSYLSRLFTHNFKHICFSFLLPHFVQGLSCCDSVTRAYISLNDSSLTI